MAQNISDLKQLSQFLDSNYRLPGGIKIGWDGILGFIPGIGDFISNIFSAYIMARAAMVGAPPAVIVRMGINVLIDNVIDLVPIVGNIFDIFWKSNLKNVALVENYVTHPSQTHKSSKIFVFLALLIMVGLMIGSTIAVIYVSLKVFEYLMTMANSNPGWS